MPSKKYIHKQVTVSQAREARSTFQNKERMANVMNHPPVWQLKCLDFNHKEWGWKNFKGTLVVEVLKKLGHYESMTWKEIFSDVKRNHSVSVEQLDKDAQKRLAALKLEYIDELFRLRLTGEQRIWGILEGYIFKVLWWDPEHKVCPSNKKHT